MAAIAKYNERQEELSSLSAIYPELAIDVENQYAASLEIPVILATSITIEERSISHGGAQSAPTISPKPNEKAHKVSYLPPLRLTFALPESYPCSEAPAVSLCTSPQWLAPSVLEDLARFAQKLWEEYGRQQVMFAFIDHLQQSAQSCFEFIQGSACYSRETLLGLLEFDAAAKRKNFLRQTYDCGICLEPKKGADCHELLRCGHVFCVPC